MSLVSRRRSRRDLEEDDDEDTTRHTLNSADEDDGPRKRRRGTKRHADRPAEDDSDAQGPEGSPDGPSANGRSLAPPDEDGYHPGAIRRVKLKNFVTYTEAEFFPGPSLNMVLGPNGTGKSSLVCAICLGLGYSPKLMGRATTVRDFVKNGTSVATIEIELQKRRQDPRHPVVRVQIDRDRNSQKWWLNGKDATHKAVQRLMADLNIQIDNLCQFLPQDRVVEFAGLSPVELLHETLRAAAPANMLQWQEQLQEMHKDSKEIQNQAASNAELLANYENRQQALQGDVERLRERETVQKRVADLQAAHALVAYNEIRTQYSETNRLLKEAQRRQRQLEDESAPSLTLVNKKQEYQEAITAALAARKSALRRAEDDADRLLAEIEGADETVNKSIAQSEAEQQAYMAKKRDLSKIVKKMGELENRLKNKPTDFDPSEYNTRIRSHEHELRDLEADDRHIQQKAQGLKQQGHQVVDERGKLEREIAALDTREGQQLKLLEKAFPDVATCWKWLQSNGDKFEQEVFGPPALTCTVKDKRYSDLVQSCLQKDDFLCFTTQSREDHKRLSNQFYKVMGLSVSIRTCLASSATIPRLPPEEAARLGFDCFVIDCINGPEPVLAMLCNEKRLHVTGVGLRDIDERQYHTLVSHDKIQAWVSGRSYYKVTRRRELGPDAVSTTTKEIQSGRWWKDDVDTSGKEELQKRLEDVKAKFAELKQESQANKEAMREKHAEITAVVAKIKDLKEQKTVLQKEHTEYRGLPAKLENEKRHKEAKMEELQVSRESIAQFDMEIDKAHVRKARAVLRHHGSLAAIRDAQNALTEAAIREIEAKSDLSGLKERNIAIMRRIEEEKSQVRELAGRREEQKDQAKAAQAKVVEVCNENEGGKEYLSQVAGDRTTTELTEEMNAEKAKLDFIHDANPNIIREFEKRAREIEKIRGRMETQQGKADELGRRIKEIRDRWEPRLDELVSKINDAFAFNFEQISCAGEVRVHKDEDFEQWALDIRVKFRENETLQQLDQQRQSGGERAVSTVFFLMALQAMAQAPFRVVDEINQGMDPRNERMVHSRMVEIACNEHTSQYFLITPKLLPGLDYHPRMTVLCIASGEHMPTDGSLLNFRRCLKIQKGIKAA